MTSPDDERRPSGLRNPQAAVRGLGAGTLALEALVLLLAIQRSAPLRLAGRWAVAAVVELAVAACVRAGMMPGSGRGTRDREAGARAVPAAARSLLVAACCSPACGLTSARTR